MRSWYDTFLSYCSAFNEVKWLLIVFQAQVCLASVYAQELVKDESKSVQYLKMAAESEVSACVDASRVLLVAAHDCTIAQTPG